MLGEDLYNLWLEKYDALASENDLPAGWYQLAPVEQSAWSALAAEVTHNG